MKYQSKWKVPRSRNHVTNGKIKDEIMKYVEPVIFEDNWEALRMVSEFEKAFAEKFDFGYVSGVQTCSAALFLALLAVGVKPGDEVITRRSHSVWVDTSTEVWLDTFSGVLAGSA